MDFSKLSTGAKLALIGGAVLIVDLFLPWYRVSGFGFSANANAFDAGFFAWAACVLGAGGAAVLLLKAMGKKDVNAGQFKPEQLAVLLGAASFVFVVLQYLTEGAAREFASFGLWIGLAAAAVVAYGSFMEMKPKGLKVPGMK